MKTKNIGIVIIALSVILVLCGLPAKKVSAQSPPTSSVYITAFDCNGQEVSRADKDKLTALLLNTNSCWIVYDRYHVQNCNNPTNVVCVNVDYPTGGMYTSSQLTPGSYGETLLYKQYHGTRVQFATPGVANSGWINGGALIVVHLGSNPETE